MATWAWILIIIAALIIAALVVSLAMRQRRTTLLRQHFGAEYDRTVAASDDQRAAESDLIERGKHRAEFDIRPLPEPARMRFVAEWRDVQERFVDQPSHAVAAADGLVYRVMGARGYPMHDFEAQANLVSVDHPDVVENYRFAHDVCTRAQSQQASTEELRAALLHYRSLFDELLQADADMADANGQRAATDAGRPHGAAGPDSPQLPMERDTR